MIRRAADFAVLALALALAAGGCTTASLPQLSAGAGPMETGSTANPAAPSPAEPAATTILAKGTPTEIYEVVARGVLGCWLGAAGPLKASHVFHAEAAPPAAGGAADITLHERDTSFRDQRGPRAFRIAFAGAPAGAQLQVVNIKMATPAAAAMVKDVETWASGAAGCEMRRLFPPPPPPPPAPPAKAKGKAQSKAARRP